MLAYRLYFFDNSGRHIERFEAIEARDDGEAVDRARLYLGCSPLELWRLGRKVHDFPPLTADLVFHPPGDGRWSADLE